MSQVPLNVFSVLEPRVSFKNSMISGNYACIKGGETYTYRNYSSSSCDNTSANFTTPPPSIDDVLSRLVVLEVPVNLIFTGPGTPSDPNLSMIQSNRDAFRAFPLESVIKNMSITVNGENLTCNINQVCHPFSRYHLDVNQINEGITPNMLDTFANYSDADGSNKNPLAWYSDNSAQNPRGAYYDYEIVENTNTRAEIRAVLKTYVMMSPFEWLTSSNNVIPGLTQLVSLDWNINFASNLSRIWSRSDTHPVPVTNLAVTMGSTSGLGNGIANIKLLWITPRADVRKYIRSMPEIKYPYFSTNRFSTTGPSVLDPNESSLIYSQVINLINVPNAIYIYAQRDESTYVNTLNGNLTTTDTFMGIDNIDITLSNVTGILSSASPQQLFDISVRNGLKNTTINEFIGTTNAFNQNVSSFTPSTKLGLSGSIIRLTPGEDISLRDHLAPGVQEKVDLQFKVTVRNINQLQSIRPQLCILVVYEGFIAIYNGTAQTKLGPLSPYDVEKGNYRPVNWNDLMKNYGGSLGDKFKAFSKDVGKYAKNVNNFLKDNKVISRASNAAALLPTRFSNDFKAVGEYANRLGYGGCDECDDDMYGGMLVEQQRGGMYGGMMVENNNLTGGKVIKRKQLKDRLKKR